MTTVNIVSAGALNVASDIVELAPHVFLATTELWCIDGDEETLAAAFLGVLHDPLCDLAILVDVQLQPLDLTVFCFVHDFVKRARCQCGYHLDDIVLVCAAREHNLSFWIAELAQCRRSDIEGNVAFAAEHGGGHVDLLDIDEYAWPEPDLVKCAVVFS